MFTEYASIPVVVIPFLIAAAIFAATRGICYYVGHTQTDNEKIIRMAGEIRFLSWPSKMHRIPYGRGQLREYYVLALKLLMRLTGMKANDHAVIVLALVSNAVSSILVFYIGQHYFGDLPGLFVFLMYVSCVWPYHVAIGTGHVLTSQALFLLSVLALILTTNLPIAAALPLYVVAGILIGMSFSSSSSSRKFPYLFIAAFLYQSKGLIVLPYDSGFDAGQLHAPWALVTFGSFALVLLGLAALGKPVSETVIRRTGIWTGADRTSERNAQLLKIVPQQIMGYSASVFAVLVLLYVVQPDARFYTDGMMILVGLGLVAVHVLAPNFITNFLRYRMFMDQTNWVSHFTVSTQFHKEIFGRTLPKNYRGGGITWTPRFLIRTVPVTVIVYVGALLMFIGAAVERISSGESSPISGTLVILSLVGVSLLPILVAEATKSLQVGKAYFSAYLGLLVIIGAGAASFMDAAGDNNWAKSALALAAVGLILGQVGITGRALVKDIIPARMGPSRLYDFLKSRNIKAIYTYDTPYNSSFAETMLYSHPGEFEVTYVGGIQEAEGGIFVVPPTSSKSIDMESDRYGVENGDFRADPILVELLDTKQIEHVSMARLDSRGTSRYYVHESEVTTYRDIFLNQISDHDRWLSHGWVVDTGRLKLSSDSESL